jgi:hypothetical protein
VALELHQQLQAHQFITLVAVVVRHTIIPPK